MYYREDPSQCKHRLIIKGFSRIHWVKLRGWTLFKKERLFNCITVDVWSDVAAWPTIRKGQDVSFSAALITFFLSHNYPNLDRLESGEVNIWQRAKCNRLDSDPGRCVKKALMITFSFSSALMLRCPDIGQMITKNLLLLRNYIYLYIISNNRPFTEMLLAYIDTGALELFLWKK